MSSDEPIQSTPELPQHEPSETLVMTDTTTDSIPVPEAEPDFDSEVSRRKPQNLLLWEQFDIVFLTGKFWQPKSGKGPVEDREIQCKLCKWTTSDPTRATSTSNMILHLTKHGIKLNG